MKTNSVLIVDDEAIVRESIRDWLKDSGYDVATAESAEEALKMVAKKDYHVLVLDVRLPGKSGLTALKEIKAIHPDVKAVIITAYPSEETTAEARRLGALDCMIKPVNPEDLEKLIRDAVASIDKEADKKPAKKAAASKKSVVISKRSFKTLITSLLQDMEVVGVKGKKGKFIFDKINNFDELKMDYDLTPIPPTKYLFPAKETILKYDLSDFKKSTPVLDNAPRAIVGVHPYDIRAIEMLDEAFITANPDPNYIARRQNSLIIGVDCLNPSPKAFSPSMGTNVAEAGFDLLLTDIGDTYMVTVGSQKGADLLKKHAQVIEPTTDDIARQKMVRDEALTKYQLALDIPRERLPKLLEDAYDDPYWAERASTCLSCGSCVMVCPTCFCFDVQDDVSLNLKDGERTRLWDGCMLVDFAKVAGGENFRHDKTSRFHHRMYRKGKYVLERYGRMGCVGCGRCGTACLAEIASPVEAFNAIAESARAKQEAARAVETIRPEKELYAPMQAELVRVDNLAAKEKVFEIKLAGGKDLGQKPGQFVELSLFGLGEAPFGVASSPTRRGTFEIAVRNVGSLTNVSHNLKKGDTVGIRGPFGNGFPLKQFEGKDLLLIAGGTGIFPMRSLIQYVLDNRKLYGRVIVLYGARGPAERLFTDDLEGWKNNANLEFHETVDRGDAIWKGNVGVITTLIPKVQLDPKKTVAVIVGPPIMYRFVIVELKKRDIADENVIMSLERRMKCGVGKCGHCQMNGLYVCQEGPVFSLAQLRTVREAV
ncbi:MAG: 4Fe-4S dicluster domain-containing protein [Dehalococcoidales bacterium]|nr:4Fe-4S dicluster domain-containing protein [Dehalococcoidales bacterium]